MDTRIKSLLAQRGFIAAAEEPALRSSLSRMGRRGELVAPLPGFYLPPGFSTFVWLRAVSAWASPAGTLHGSSAASLWLPTLASPVAFVAHPSLRSRPGVVVARRTVPNEFVELRHGLRYAGPAYAAAELASDDDGRAMCEALRLRLADADTLTAAVDALSGTPGQAVRRKVVAESAGNPWSYAELRLQRILVEAGITDWVANRPLWLEGREVVPDVRFRHRRLIIEFDGRQTHNDPASFLGDRERLNLFESHGYHILRFGWEHLDQPEYIVRSVRAALRAAAPR